MPSKTTTKPESAKVAAKPVKKTAKTVVAKETKSVDVVEKKTTTVKKVAEKKNLQVEVLGIDGKSTGKMTLPEEIFGEKVNKTLLAQAVRVYLANKRQGNASTKTRGEVDGSTAKIYRQKGTGRARHGSKRAPIFVHGGIVHGPKPRDFSLDLPKKMRRKALFSALSAKFADGKITVVSGLVELEPKTKQFVSAITNFGVSEQKRKVLVVTLNETKNIKRAAGNVVGVTCSAARRLNAYDVLAHKELILMKESIEEMTNTFLKKD